MSTLDYQNRDDARKKPGLLRSLFGPSKKEVWNQLAGQVGGQFVAGGFLRREKVVANVGQWMVTLDTFDSGNAENSTTYTRMRAPYVNADGFRFRIYRAGIFTAVGEMLGLRDIRIGDTAFDEAFVVTASSEKKARLLLSNEEIRRLMDAQPRIRIEVKDDEGWFGSHFPQGVDELCFTAEGVIKDIERLRGLFELFSAMLHQLCQIGSAYENDPGVELR